MKTNLLSFWDKNPRSITDTNLEKLKISLQKDPAFLGSGSTLIASEMLNRVCYGVEFDPMYIQIIMMRYNTFMSGDTEIKCLNRTIDIDKILSYSIE